MSELEDKLNSILGNPQAMSQIMSLAQSLGGSGASSSDQAAPASPPAPPPDQTPAAAPSGEVPNLGALLGSLTGEGGGLDPRLLTLASRVLSEYQSNDDGRTALLQSLRPFVKEQRYAKLDKAIQIARLSRMIRVALDVMKGGGSEHV